MKKKIQNKDILTLFEAINMLELTNPDLPFKVFYANNKNRNRIKEPFKEINNGRFKLLETHGIKDPKSPVGYKLEKDKRTFAFKDLKSRTKFEDELAPILSEEVEIDFYTIGIDEFENVKADRKQFPLVDFYLEWLVTD